MAAALLKVLFVSPVVPYPPDTGGKIRTFRLLRELRGRAEVHLLAVHESEAARAELVHLEQHCASCRGFPRAQPGAWLRWTRPKLERWFHSPALAAALREELARGAFDLVHLDEMLLARVPPQPAGVPVIVHHHKLDTALHARLPGAGGWLQRFDRLKLRRLEAAAVARHPFHVLASAEDALRLRERHPGLRTAVVESGFDPEYFRPPSAPRARDELVFLGSMDYAPNVDGLAWFLREVLPMIHAERPGVVVNVVGSSPTAEVRELAGAGVRVLGRVDDVRQHLGRASVLVVPLRIGGGTRVKIVEAIGMGTPVVTTSIGAEGLELRDPDHVAIADGAPAFAASVLAVLTDPAAAEARARRAREFALGRYTWAELAGKLLAAWESLARPDPAARALTAAGAATNAPRSR